MTAKPADWLPLLDEIADKAETIAMRLFRSRGLKTQAKADASPVTEADRGIEETARRLVAGRHPGMGVLGEEFGEEGDAGLRLVIDPIDGTSNFTRGIPIWATLLAVEEAGEVTAGVVSAPALGSRWRASRGRGAWEGRRRLHVSRISDLARAQVFHSNLGRSEGRPPDGFIRLLGQVNRTRGIGDFWQHLLVADGAGEAALDPVVSPWDVAPLQVIVEEAGGRMTTTSGARTIHGGSMLTTNGLVHEAVLEALRR